MGTRQNVQASHSTYKVTSFIDFTPYFQQFEKYLEAFKVSIKAFENDPILQEFRVVTTTAASDKKGACRHYPICRIQPLLFKLRYEQAQMATYRHQ